MLQLLHIENIAVIEKVELQFTKGFNVLTGETGAGKSIIIDAIGAIMGERTSRDLIRTGCQKAYVSAAFTDFSEEVMKFLSNNDLEGEESNTLYITRTLLCDGKNNCKVNGRPAPLPVLRELANLLINIHGQHDGQQLLSPENHIHYLDSYAENEDILTIYQNTYKELGAIKTKLKSLFMDEDEKHKRIDMFEFQIQEIENAKLKCGEEEELTDRKNILNNSGKILDVISNSDIALNGNEDFAGICSLIDNVSKSLLQVTQISDQFISLYNKIEEFRYQAEDISSEFRDLKNSFEFSPDELAKTNDRLDLIYQLKLKYGNGIELILKYLEQIKNELSEIECSEEKAIELKKEYDQKRKEAQKLAAVLSDRRKSAATELEREINDELHQLDMGKAKFAISVSDYETVNGYKLTPSGFNEVEFFISTNAGEPQKPLIKIASGGELARIMLAIKNILAQNDEIDTLIFDEIDTGVSGRAAQKIANKLYDVSCLKQVLCVTHLSQIAAMADTHFLTSKDDRDGKTYTEVNLLSFTDRVQEISRITAGADITQITLENAREILNLAEKSKMISERKKVNDSI